MKHRCLFSIEPILNRHFYILVLALFVLSGCASRVPVPSDDHRTTLWERNKRELQSMENWSMKGRIAMRVEKDGWSASLHWQQTRQDYLLRLIAPLGQGVYELRGNQDGVQLKTAKDGVLRAQDPESLLQQNLGWQVPVSGLQYWVRGLPQPGVAIEGLQLDGKGRLSELAQNGWRISYKSFLSEVDYDLPKKLSLQNGKVTLRFSIKGWDIPL